MHVPSFICLSTILLLTWLGAAYFHEIPHERYPKQGRLSSNASDTEAKEAATTFLVNVSKEDESR